MTFDRNRLARGVAVALVSLFLVAGAAFATGGILTPLTSPAGPSTEGTETPEPSAKPAASDDHGDDAPPPSASPDDHSGADDDDDSGSDDSELGSDDGGSSGDESDDD